MTAKDQFFKNSTKCQNLAVKVLNGPFLKTKKNNQKLEAKAWQHTRSDATRKEVTVALQILICQQKLF